ncbi:MAG: uroporphyrinogen-III synthase [Methanobrevibacter sp.]|jgi:uroporphyrinogen-III synthase|nr:uroporphyrinogen-III synthase [Candidatus Methanovirga basalitermitum]
MKNKEKIVAITRPFDRVDEVHEIIESFNAKAFIAPTLELEIVNSRSLKDLISNLNKINWLIFTSPTAIKSIINFYPDFKERLSNKTKIAAIGSKTAEKLAQYDLNIDIIPNDFTAEGLIKSFNRLDIKDKLIGIPRTLDARLILPDKLKELGANVLIAEAYKSRLPLDTIRIEVLISKILSDEIDAIIFTSPLTVKNLFKIAVDEQIDELVNKLSTNILTVAIGPITHKTLDKLGVDSIYPNKYTVKDMLELLFETL